MKLNSAPLRVSQVNSYFLKFVVVSRGSHFASQGNWSCFNDLSKKNMSGCYWSVTGCDTPACDLSHTHSPVCNLHPHNNITSLGCFLSSQIFQQLDVGLIQPDLINWFVWRLILDLTRSDSRVTTHTFFSSAQWAVMRILAGWQHRQQRYLLINWITMNLITRLPRYRKLYHRKI